MLHGGREASGFVPGEVRGAVAWGPGGPRISLERDAFSKNKHFSVSCQKKVFNKFVDLEIAEHVSCLSQPMAPGTVLQEGQGGVRLRTTESSRGSCRGFAGAPSLLQAGHIF